MLIAVLTKAAKQNLFSFIHQKNPSKTQISRHYKNNVFSIIEILVYRDIVKFTSGAYEISSSFVYKKDIVAFEAFLVHRDGMYSAITATEAKICYDMIPLKEGGKNYVLAMDFKARIEKMRISDYINLSQYRNLLDAGCGSGYYSEQFLSISPKSTATLIDYDVILNETKKIIGKQIKTRINLKPCNLLEKTVTSTNHDIAFLFSVIHQYGEKEIILLLKNIRDMLTAGGTLLIYDYIPKNKFNLSSYIFSTMMQSVTPHGKVYSLKELDGILLKTGFKVERFIPVTDNQRSLLVCSRKD